MGTRNLALRCVLLVVAWAMVCGTSTVARGQEPCPREWQPFDISTAAFPGTNGAVIATVMWDQDGAGPITPKLVVGGTFTVAGNAVASNIAIYDLVEGSWSALGSGMNNSVNALAVLPNGDLIAGGTFTSAGGGAASRIARWNGSSWTALGQGVAGGVLALAVLPSGDLVAGGGFSSAGGMAANRIARWDGSSWTPLGLGVNGEVLALAILSTGDLVVGGFFNSAGGQESFNNIARWNGTSWSRLESGTNGSVRALAVMPNGDLIAGGTFTTAGGFASTANNIARWNGATWSGLDVSRGGPFGSVRALVALPGGDLIVGGTFTFIPGPFNAVSASRIARWSRSSSTWSAVGSGVNNDVLTVAVLANGDLIAGGLFTPSPTLAANFIARFDGGVSGSNSWQAMGAGINNAVLSLAALPSGNLIAAGSFTSVGGVVANRIARWNGASWSALAGGLSETIWALAALPNGDLIAGTSAVGSTANLVQRWNGSIWSPLGPTAANSSFSAIFALATLPSGELIAGGSFSTIGSLSSSNIARWNGSSWTPLGSGMNFPVYALAVMPNGDLIAGGNFTTAGGVAANRIARWNGASWSALGAGVSGSVNALLVHPSGDLIAGGGFTVAGSNFASNIARWNGASWAPMGPGLNSTVNALAVLPSGDLAAGGFFTMAGDEPVNNIARWNGTSWARLGSGVNSDVYTFGALPNGDLIAGGVFTATRATVAPFLARYSGVPGMSSHPRSRSIIAGQTLVLSATTTSSVTGVSVQWQRNGIDLADGDGGASVGGGVVSGAFSSLVSPSDGTPATLTITNVQETDAGNYTAMFSNTCGNTLSAAAIVTVACSLSDLVGGNGNPPADGSVDGNDFQAFLNAFGSGDRLADIVGGDGNPPADGSVDGNDFQAFLNAFAAGC